MKAQKRCKECKWCVEGVCVRLPPVVVSTTDSSGDLDSVYPEVDYTTISCGEFRLQSRS